MIQKVRRAIRLNLEDGLLIIFRIQYCVSAGAARDRSCEPAKSVLKWWYKIQKIRWNWLGGGFPQKEVETVKIL